MTELELRSPVRHIATHSESYVDELVARAQAGDTAAFGALYDEYAPRVYRYLSARLSQQADAEDLLHRVFVKMIESIGRYRPTGTPFGAWLFRIARNAMIDELRARPRDVTIDVIDAISPGGSSDPVGAAEREAERDEIRGALAELTEEQREVILYRFFAGLTTHETATLMGKREGSIRALQFRALQSLRRRLGTGPDRLRSAS